MHWSLQSPAEQELRSLILLVEDENGGIHAEDTDPARCAELRAILAAEEAVLDAEMARDYHAEMARRRRSTRLPLWRHLFVALRSLLGCFRGYRRR